MMRMARTSQSAAASSWPQEGRWVLKAAQSPVLQAVFTWSCLRMQTCRGQQLPPLDILLIDYIP